MSTWTSFVKIWTVNNCELNADFLTYDPGTREPGVWLPGPRSLSIPSPKKVAKDISVNNQDILALINDIVIISQISHFQLFADHTSILRP